MSLPWLGIVWNVCVLASTSSSSSSSSSASLPYSSCGTCKIHIVDSDVPNRTKCITKDSRMHREQSETHGWSVRPECLLDFISMWNTLRRSWTRVRALASQAKAATQSDRPSNPIRSVRESKCNGNDYRRPNCNGIPLDRFELSHFLSYL